VDEYGEDEAPFPPSVVAIVLIPKLGISDRTAGLFLALQKCDYFHDQSIVDVGRFGSRWMHY
jgi:hypothetical protein